MKEIATSQCSTRVYTGWRSTSPRRTTVLPMRSNARRACSSKRSTEELMVAPFASLQSDLDVLRSLEHLPAVAALVQRLRDGKRLPEYRDLPSPNLWVSPTISRRCSWVV